MGDLGSIALRIVKLVAIVKDVWLIELGDGSCR